MASAVRSPLAPSGHRPTRICDIHTLHAATPTSSSHEVQGFLFPPTFSSKLYGINSSNSSEDMGDLLSPLLGALNPEDMEDPESFGSSTRGTNGESTSSKTDCASTYKPRAPSSGISSRERRGVSSLFRPAGMAFLHPRSIFAPLPYSFPIC